MFVLILGLGIIAVPTGLIASALTKVRKEEGDRQQAKAMSARTNATMGVKESSDSTD
jgi:hypothetical protein